MLVIERIVLDDWTFPVDDQTYLVDDRTYCNRLLNASHFQLDILPWMIDHVTFFIEGFAADDWTFDVADQTD